MHTGTTDATGHPGRRPAAQPAGGTGEVLSVSSGLTSRPDPDQTWRRVRDLAAVPLMVVLAFALLAALSIIVDI
ncbi:MAG: hypothetical protein ACJ786_16715, partial [Catenulispora sp.]